jgi:hypothetical protein
VLGSQHHVGGAEERVRPRGEDGDGHRLARVLPHDVGKRISAPSLRPIQFSCALRVVSDQSSVLRFSSSFPAYRVMRKNHWLRNLISTAVPHRSHSPPTTCSLASTVLQLGHQLTGASFFSASPAL